MEGKDGRTERATGKRRNEARQDGNLVYSMEILSVVTLFLGLMVLRFFGPSIFEQMAYLLREVCRFPHLGIWSPLFVRDLMIDGSLLLAYILIPICGICMLGGIVASMAQTGVYFETKPLEWKFGGLNPIAGFRNLFSTQTLINLGLSILKIAVIGGVIYLATRNRILEATGLIYAAPAAFIQWTGLLIYRITIAVLSLFVILAALDWAWKKYQHEKNLMMTKEEVKEEHKQQEPNPIIKRAQRKKMRELSLASMIAAVPKATVIVTNPTHVAVALQYDPETMDAPKVTAKGLRLVAERIKRIALENDIPILERPALARALYKQVEVDREIPSLFYEAVAEILAYLHKLGRRVMRPV